MTHRTHIDILRCHDPTEPLIRDLVFVNVAGSDGENFDLHLTRVPCLGEEIVRDNNSYRVERVYHFKVDGEGFAPYGWHAMVDAKFIPEVPVPARKGKRIGLYSTARSKRKTGRR